MARLDAAYLTPQAHEYQNGKGVCAMGQVLYSLPSQAPPCRHERPRHPRLSDASGGGGTGDGFHAQGRVAGADLPLPSRPQTAFASVGRDRTCQAIATGACRVCTVGSHQDTAQLAGTPHPMARRLYGVGLRLIDLYFSYRGKDFVTEATQCWPRVGRRAQVTRAEIEYAF